MGSISPEQDKTALVVAVPEVEPLVGGFRAELDVAGIAGLPAHVTVLSPFLPPASIDDRALAELRRLFAGSRRFEFSLVGLCGFPSVVYLAPDPLEPFDALTGAVCERFPGYPPYRGAFARPVPHLTVAQSPPAADLVPVVASLLSRVGPSLPLRCSVREVCLAGKRAGRWSIDARLPLA